MYRFLILCFICIFFVSGCLSGNSQLLRKESRADTAYMALNSSLSNSAASVPAIEVAEQPQVDPAQQNRLVVYNAVINVVVERISDSMSQIESIVVGMGGYMQEMSSYSITLKVPADRFTDAIAEVEKLGRVVARDIKGTDVTEEMRDLDIRLQNSEQAREKLINLLEKAEDVEDILAIEKELQRITETIETLKGKMQYLQSKIDFSTLTVEFNSPIQQEDLISLTPFAWVRELGSELTKPVSTRTSNPGIFSPKMFTLPDGYIKYYQDSDSARAMSAEGVMIYVHKEKNYSGGSNEFWSSLVERVLVEQQAIHIDEQSELKLNNKKDAIIFKASKQIGAKNYGYLLTLVPTKKKVYVFEAWGPLQECEKDESKLEEAVLSLKMY